MKKQQIAIFLQLYVTTRVTFALFFIRSRHFPSMKLRDCSKILVFLKLAHLLLHLSYRKVQGKRWCYSPSWCTFLANLNNARSHRSFYEYWKKQVFKTRPWFKTWLGNFFVSVFPILFGSGSGLKTNFFSEKYWNLLELSLKYLTLGWCFLLFDPMY